MINLDNRMIRHSSITDQYVDDLRTQFFELSELVKFSQAWEETSAVLRCRTYRFTRALKLIKDGASLDEVEAVLKK